MHFTGIFAMGRRIVDYFYDPLSQAGIPSYNTAGVITYRANDFLQGLILRDCAGAGRADLTPTAQQIIDALTVGLRPPVVGQGFDFDLRNTSGGAFTITLTAGTGVTISGTATIAQNNQKRFRVVITTIGAVPAVTIYSMGTVVF